MDLSHLFNSPFFVGAAGALVSLRFSHDLTWHQRLMTFVCGVLIAGYVAVPLGRWLKLSAEGDILGVAFALGVLGLSVVAAAWKAAADIELAKIVSSWLTRR